MVADITPDFSQGTIEVSSNPMDMAIQGDGFFIVQGSSGEQLYTRNGVFKLNADNEVTTITGNRVLGYGINDQFQIQTTQLVPLEIQLGGSQVAEATQNVYLEGTLTPSGDGGRHRRDHQDRRPRRRLVQSALRARRRSGRLGGTGRHDLGRSPPAGGAMAPGTYYYKIVYGDGSTPPYLGTESIASQTFSATVAAGDSGHRPVRLPGRRRRLLQDMADLSQRGG